ncbi:hypothetical protein BH23GEM3_BH23GEM3_24780 [soil metagenome]|jgi:hypothetical protein
MKDPQTDQQFDTLAAQVYDWTESAVALDEGHFPNELLSELEDLITDLKAYLEDDETRRDRREVIELFVSPEMAEVVDRFARVRRMLERAWGSQLMDLLEEESSGMEPLDDDEDDE